MMGSFIWVAVAHLQAIPFGGNEDRGSGSNVKTHFIYIITGIFGLPSLLRL